MVTLGVLTTGSFVTLFLRMTANLWLPLSGELSPEAAEGGPPHHKLLAVLSAGEGSRMATLGVQAKETAGEAETTRPGNTGCLVFLFFCVFIRLYSYNM